MATIKFLLQSKSSNCEIYLRLSINRKQILKRKTGLQIDFKEWSKEKGLPKQTIAKNKKLTTDLRSLQNQVLTDLNNSSAKGETINGDWLSLHIDLFFNRVSKTNESELLVDWIQYIIDDAPNRENNKKTRGISISRINAYKALKKSLIEYESKKRNKYKVKEVTPKFTKSFLTWLVDEKKYSESASQKKISDLKVVCNEASMHGIEISPQLKKIKTGKTNAEHIIYLNNEELRQIKDTDITLPALVNARKWLVLGCNLGQRGGDLLKITEKNFSTIGSIPIVEIIQQKTGKLIQIPANEEVQKVFESGLPYEISTQKFNTHLKRLCKEAEINTPTKGGKIIVNDKKETRKVIDIYPKYELISSHVCRRSFASNYYSIMPTPLIMQITGHSTEKMLLKYIGKKSKDYIVDIANYMSIASQKSKKESSLTVIKNSVNS